MLHNALSKIKLRQYQTDISCQGVEILRRLNILYLAMAVRTGKTFTALEIARLFGAKKVLFLTKKKAIASIEADYVALNPGYECIIINDESLHKIDLSGVDLLIHDEHHRVGAFPKPGAGCRAIKDQLGHLPHIYLSGTPTPESFSQIYHQFWTSNASPFPDANFYKWAKKYVNVTQRRLAHGIVNDYTKAYWPMIGPIVAPYMISYTQEQAGFQVDLKEHFIKVPVSQTVKTVSQILLRDGVVRGQTGTISAANPAILQQKIHQIHSGTIILDEDEEGKARSVILDTGKAEAIKAQFAGQKIVIFYQFCAELIAIQSVLGGAVTTSLKEWCTTGKSIALQIVSGREGLNLSAGEAIVFYNISFSATSYLQARDRLTTATRRRSDVYWLMSDGGIEEKIYKTVKGKQNYTTQHFVRDFGMMNHAKAA